MADCIIKSRNAVRAEIFGLKLSFTSKLILLRSTPHDHTEYQFSERYGYISFSSTLQDNDKGTRFKHIQYRHQKERWDDVVVHMTNREEDRAWREATKMLGMGYDLVGQLCHVTKSKIWKPSEKKIWCTKAVGRVVYAGRTDFWDFLNMFDLTTELIPSQMDIMARYFFKRDSATNELGALLEEYAEINNIDLLICELKKLNATL